MTVVILAYISVGLITLGWVITILFDTASKVKSKLEGKNKEDEQQ